jgi:hypothetical protein
VRKIIVTHFNPDLDAITSAWLIKKFLPGWKKAEVKFVAPGKTLDNKLVDSNSDILHIDTGLGRFNHHQRDEPTCAAKLILEWLSEENPKIKKDEALRRLTNVVLEIDHFQEVYWPNPDSDRYEFFLQPIIKGLELIEENDRKALGFGLLALDGTYKSFQNKVWAENEIEKGVKFKSCWGKALGVETKNDAVIHLAQKMGVKLVVRKDPKKGFVRIKTIPDPKLDLTCAFKKLKKKDPKATWFLHIDRHQLLNGSIRDPSMKPTKLTLLEVIEVLKSC